MSKIYIAGPWIHRNLVIALAEILIKAGHTITYDWWNYEGKDERKESNEFLCKCAEKDREGVRTADTLILYNSCKSEGKAVEQGMALAWGKKIICYTPAGSVNKNIFHYLPEYIHVTTIEDLFREL